MRASAQLRMLLLVAALLAMRGSASADLAPDEEVARREYEAGADAYDKNDYANALLHFNAAKQAKPAPAFDYNIARCLDRLGRWREAADAYERFVHAAPASENVVELRARIVELRQRQAPPADATAPATIATPAPSPSSPPSPPSPPRRLRLAAEILLGGALAAELAGSVVYGTAYHDFVSDRDGKCKGGVCPAGTLVNEVHAREAAAGVLWGIGSAALIADVVLWVIDARHHHAPRADASRGVLRF